MALVQAKVSEQAPLNSPGVESRLRARAPNPKLEEIMDFLSSLVVNKPFNILIVAGRFKTPVRESSLKPPSPQEPAGRYAGRFNPQGG